MDPYSDHKHKELFLRQLTDLRYVPRVGAAFGVSKESYTSTENMVHYGTGQGNVVSVFVCQFGTSVIFYLLEDEFQGWKVTDEQGRVTGCKLAIGFVNDTDFFVQRRENTIA